MMRRVRWMTLVLGIALSMSCGGDDGGGDGASPGGSGGAGGSRAGAGGGGMVPGMGVACGTTRCQPPSGVMGAQACCFDAFSSTCGMLGGFGGMACVMIPETDERCPSVSFAMGAFVLPSCCTADNQCGTTGGMFGGSSGCMSYADTRAMILAMFPGAGGAGTGGAGAGAGADEDGGAPMMGPMLPMGFNPANILAMFPEPMACQ